MTSNQYIDARKRFRALLITANVVFLVGFGLGFWGMFITVETEVNLFNTILTFSGFIIGTLVHIIVIIYLEIRYKDFVKEDPRIYYNQGCVIIIFILVTAFLLSIFFAS